MPGWIFIVLGFAIYFVTVFTGKVSDSKYTYDTDNVSIEYNDESDINDSSDIDYYLDSDTESDIYVSNSENATYRPGFTRNMNNVVPYEINLFDDEDIENSTPVTIFWEDNGDWYVDRVGCVLSANNLDETVTYSSHYVKANSKDTVQKL